MAKIYTELEFGDPVWIITKGYVDTQFVADDGRLVTVLEDGTSLWEDQDDLVAVITALDE